MYSPNPKQIYYHSKNSAGIAYLARWRIIIDPGGKWTFDNSSCPWTQYCTRIIDMLFLERVTEFNPSRQGHRRLFKFQVTHVGQGKTWKVKSIFTRDTRWSATTQTSFCRVLRCGALQVFENNTSLIWATSDVRHTLRSASAKISDGWRNMQILIWTSKHPNVLESDHLSHR